MTFGALMRDFLSDVEDANTAAVSSVSDAIVQCTADGGLVYAAGAGHSLAAVNEAFYRAGGLAFVRPIHDARLLPLNGAQASTDAERESGLAAEILAKYEITASDVLIVFSNSGINFYPVELALAAKEIGIMVIAFTSLTASAAAPLRAGYRLFDIADICLDTRVPPGDAAWPTEAPVTGPMSSLANCFLWNLVLAEVHRTAAERGVELPMWVSANSSDADANARTLAAYADRVPELR